MPEISDLAILTELLSSDRVVFYSPVNGDSYTVSGSNLAKSLKELITFDDDKLTQYYSPSATGFSVQINNDSLSVFLLMTPTGAFAAGTFILPLKDNCVDKQEIQVITTQAVTTLTINGNGSSLVGAPTTLAANGYFKLRFDSINSTWYRIG